MKLSDLSKVNTEEVVIRYEAQSDSNRDEHGDIKRRGMFAEVMSRMVRNRTCILGFVILVVVVVACLGANIWAPYGYDDQNVMEKFIEPCAEHLMGTDNYGRDIFSRILYGGRTSLLIGFSAEAIALVFGIILGSIAGFYGGKTDNIIMRVLDVIMSMPNLLLAIVISATMGGGVGNAILAVGLAGIPGMARTVRGPILAIKQNEFVEAARSLNAKNKRIIFRHILPNVLSPIIVQATLGVASSIIAAASLSFLGLGVQPPHPEWGAMLSASRIYIREHAYMVTFPGLAIAMVVISLNLFGDGLRDALDPRLKN